MALDEKYVEKKGQCEYTGPVMHTDGLPVNPSDEIFRGKPLPVRRTSEATVRRDFSDVTKAPLHRSEGPGPDEVKK